MKRINLLVMIILFLLCVSMALGQITWTSLTALPYGRQMCGIAATQEPPYYIYVIGGNVGGVVAGETMDSLYDSLGILMAPISYVDGTIGTWTFVGNAPATSNTTATSCLAYTENACFCYKGFLYIGGGNNNSASDPNRTEVLYAQIYSDGTLGTWHTQSFCPPGNGESSNICFAYNDRFYIIGGSDNSGTRSALCFYAPINPGGSVGTFVQASNSLPGGRWFHRGGVKDGYIYVMGGRDASAIQNTVWSALINGDGSIGTWSTQTSLPVGTGTGYSDGAGFFYGGNIYYCGGSDGVAGYNSTVYKAPLSAGGTVGAWTSDTALPTTRRRSGAVTVGNNIYLAGWRENAGSVPTYVYGQIGALAPPTAAKSWEIYK